MDPRPARRPYELISRNALIRDDFASRQVESDVEGLLKMYESRGSMADGFGTLVRRRDGKIGDRFAHDEMKRLHRPVATACSTETSDLSFIGEDSLLTWLATLVRQLSAGGAQAPPDLLLPMTALHGAR